MLFGVSFAQPAFLLAALLALPALWWARRGAGRVVFSSLRALPAGGGTWRTALAWVPDAMLTIAVVSLAIALAGPRKGDKSSRVQRDGIAIMMVVDHSGSMRAQDLADKHVVTRLDAVKQVFESFVRGGGNLDGRDDDAIGLIAFAHYADTLSPITLDHGNLLTALRGLDIVREQNDDGTAIGAGLELAVQRLSDFKAKSKIIVLLTDGESNIHTIDEQTAIDDAVTAGIKVYTIGAGTNGVAPIQMEDGGPVMQMRVEIDEGLLRKIADKTGGQYFRATDHASLAKIYAQIDKLERTKLEETRFKEFNQYYVWFVIVALGLVVLALGLRGTVLRRLP
jgi:Ca-activated chloride channel family protein